MHDIFKFKNLVRNGRFCFQVFVSQPAASPDQQSGFSSSFADKLTSITLRSFELLHWLMPSIFVFHHAAFKVSQTFITTCCCSFTFLSTCSKWVSFLGLKFSSAWCKKEKRILLEMSWFDRKSTGFIYEKARFATQGCTCIVLCGHHFHE